MAKKPAFQTISNILTALPFINSNYNAIDTAFENTLSLDGSTPNSLGADIDMNSNDILNAKTVKANSLFLNGQKVVSTTSTIGWDGAWTTATSYAVNTLIENGGNSYICVTAHTSGVFATDLASGNWELSASKGDAGATGAAGPVGSGDLVLLDTATASASASIDLTNFNDTLYRGYVVVIDYLLPATDGANLYLRTSNDDGSSYNTGSSDYTYSMLQLIHDAPGFAASHDISGVGSGASGATSIQICTAVGTGTNESGAVGRVELFNPEGASIQHLVRTDVEYIDSDGYVRFRKGSGKRRNTQETISGLQFSFSTGNIESGKVYLYGIGIAGVNPSDLGNGQPIDDTLTALAGLSTGANKIPYSTGTDTFGQLDFLDEDDMSSDSATGVPTQQSVKAYVDANVPTSADCWITGFTSTLSTSEASLNAGAVTVWSDSVPVELVGKYLVEFEFSTQTDSTTGDTWTPQIRLKNGTTDIYSAGWSQDDDNNVYTHPSYVDSSWRFGKIITFAGGETLSLVWDQDTSTDITRAWVDSLQVKVTGPFVEVT